MRIRNLNSAAVMIETKGLKILCDPWLVDGEHYGSWAIYPPMPFAAEDYDEVDFIYVSHIHHDHCSLKTLSRLKKSIPVLIHRYDEKYLKMNIERLGYDVIELPNDTDYDLGNGVTMNIVAADYCDPEICNRYYGCGIIESDFGSTQIDSLCVINDGTYTVLNTNDCPWELSERSVEAILEKYPRINFLLMGYLGAGPYPQCFASLTNEEKMIAANAKRDQFIRKGEAYLERIKPDFYMPFAGTYLLAGRLSAINDFRGNPDIEWARDYFTGSPRVPEKSQCVLLNQKACFDLESGESSEEYTPIDHEHKKAFVTNVLSKRKLDYESEELPKIEQFMELLPKAYDRFDRRRELIDYSSETVVVLSLVDGMAAFISMNGGSYKVANADKANSLEHFVQVTIDPRLLIKILSGPRYAHYNNAEGGSHITFFRKPKHHFERQVYYCMNFFHA